MVFLLCCFPWRLPVDPFAYFVLWTPNIYLWEKLLKEQNLFGDLRTGIYIICMRSLEQKKRIKKNHHFWEASKEPWKVPPSLSLDRSKRSFPLYLALTSAPCWFGTKSHQFERWAQRALKKCTPLYDVYTLLVTGAPLKHLYFTPKFHLQWNIFFSFCSWFQVLGNLLSDLLEI